MDTENTPLNYHILIKFFLPLAVFPILVALSHTIINSALARMSSPELSIAVFTVVKSVTNIINAPSIMTRQLFTSVIEDKRSYYLARNFAFVLMFILFGLIMSLSITPLGDFVFKHIIGLQSQKEVNLATSAMMVTAFLPIAVVLRNAYQGIATGLKKTLLILPGVVLRVISIVVFLGWVVKTNIINGVIAGCLAYVMGIALEGVFILGGLKYNSGSIIDAANKMPPSDFDKEKLDYYKIFKFFLPLAFTIMITMFIQPVIQSGLARSSSPVRSLAAYGVSWTLVTMLAGPLRMLHQITLVHHNSDENMRKIKIFNFSLGVLTSVIIVIFALSPIGYYVLRNLIAVSHDITLLAQKVILAFAIFPLARAFRETYWGMMMKKRTTQVIAKAKGLNLFAVILSLMILLGFINIYFNIEPAVLGAVVFTIGEFLETFIIKKNSKNV